MGLLGKTLELAKKATSSVIESANRKLEEARQKRIEEEKKFLQEFPYKYRYIIKQGETLSLDLVLWEGLERNSYVVFDDKENPVYIAKGTFWMGRHHFIVTDNNKKRCCKINKALFNVPLPFIKERKTCKIALSEEEPFEIGTCISFKEREYSISKDGMSIKADEKEKEFKIFRNNNDTPDIHIYKIRSGEFLKGKYCVGFDNYADGILALSLAVGIDTIRFSLD